MGGGRAIAAGVVLGNAGVAAAWHLRGTCVGALVLSRQAGSERAGTSAADPAASRHRVPAAADLWHQGADGQPFAGYGHRAGLSLDGGRACGRRDGISADGARDPPVDRGGRSKARASGIDAWRVAHLGVRDSHLAADAAGDHRRQHPWLCQGDGRIRRNDHVRLEHPRRDPHSAIGDIRVPASARRRDLGDAAGSGVGSGGDGCAADVRMAGAQGREKDVGLMTLSVDIRHFFGDFTLDVRFEAPPGLTVLFGRSGSGKSTVINAVAGLLAPDEGLITVEGETLLDRARGIDLAPHRRGLGYIFQEGRLFPHMTVRQNLLFSRWFRKGTRSDFSDVVEMLGIGALLDRRPGALSGGEKQRVAIGRALLGDPRIILADEPLAALDEPRKAEILPYFERLRDEISVPILYVSHSATEVARLATTVVTLENGRVVAQGSAADVLGNVGAMGARGAASVLTARVVCHHADGLSELAAAAGALWLPRVA